MMGPIVAWLADCEGEAYRTCERVIFPKDYVRALLTDQIGVTDHSDASGSGMYDVRRGGWSPEVVAAFGVDRALLPEIRWAGDVAGTVSARAGAVYHLPVGIPVVVGGGDTPTALYGSALQGETTGQVSVGTAVQASRACGGGDAVSRDTRGSALNYFVGCEPRSRVPRGGDAQRGNRAGVGEEDGCMADRGRRRTTVFRDGGRVIRVDWSFCRTSPVSVLLL